MVIFCFCDNFKTIYPFIGWGQKLLYVGHIFHKYLSNRPNSKKVMGSENFDIQKTTNFVH